jgi:hypothetical protein
MGAGIRNDDGDRANGLWFAAGEVLFADVLLLPNGMSKVGAYT